MRQFPIRWLVVPSLHDLRSWMIRTVPASTMDRVRRVVHISMESSQPSSSIPTSSACHPHRYCIPWSWRYSEPSYLLYTLRKRRLMWKWKCSAVLGYYMNVCLMRILFCTLVMVAFLDAYVGSDHPSSTGSAFYLSSFPFLLVPKTSILNR